MKSKVIRQALRVLLGLLGAGTGVALTLGGMQLYRFTHPAQELPITALVIAFIGMSLLFGALFFYFGKSLIAHGIGWMTDLVVRFDRMPVGLLLSSVAGLIVGFVVAALLTQILQFLGDSMFTVAFASILYLIFGVIGYTIGWRRSEDLVRLMTRLPGLRSRRFSRKDGRSLRHEPAAIPAKLLDTSALIDGRIAEVCKLGFVEGVLVVPAFIAEELRSIADSTDPLRRTRGRRGLDVLRHMQDDMKLPIQVDDTSFSDLTDTDAMLLRLARQRNAAIITGDMNLCKAAQAIGVQVLNLNGLAGALRPTVHAGDELVLAVTREGKEPGQGVAYMDDGTMVVIDSGRAHVGSTVTVVVTSALQTNSGRMVFARLKADT